MTMEEALKRIREAGYGGVAIWQNGGYGQYMGCLLDTHINKVVGTHLYDYQPTALAVVELLYMMAEDMKKCDKPPSPSAVSIAAYPEQRGLHVHVRLFTGKDAEHRSLVGTMVFRADEWPSVSTALAGIGCDVAPMEDRTITIRI